MKQLLCILLFAIIGNSNLIAQRGGLDDELATDSKKCVAPFITSASYNPMLQTFTLTWSGGTGYYQVQLNGIINQQILIGTSYTWYNVTDPASVACVQSYCAKASPPFSNWVCTDDEFYRCGVTELSATTSGTLTDQGIVTVDLNWSGLASGYEIQVNGVATPPMILSPSTYSHTLTFDTPGTFEICVRAFCESFFARGKKCITIIIDPEDCTEVTVTDCPNPTAGQDFRSDDPGSFTQIQEIKNDLNNPSASTYSEMFGVNGIFDWVHFTDNGACGPNPPNPFSDIMTGGEVRIFHQMDRDLGTIANPCTAIPPNDPSFPGAYDFTNYHDLYSDIVADGFQVRATLVQIACGFGFPDAWYTEDEWGDIPHEVGNEAYYNSVIENMDDYIFALLSTMNPPGCDCEPTPQSTNPCLLATLEIGNEPWGYPDARVYHSILEGGLNAAERFESQGGCKPTILAGAFQNFREDLEGCDAGCDTNVQNSACQFDNMAQYLPCELAERLDAINIHTYSFPWEENPSSLNLSPENPNSEINQMVNAIDWINQNTPGAPLHVTEYGYDTNNPVTDVSECAQAAYIVRTLLLQSRLHVERSTLYGGFDIAYRIDQNADAVFHNYNFSGIRTIGRSATCPGDPTPVNGVPKRAFHTIGHFQEVFGDLSFQEAIVEDGELYAYILGNESESFLVFWDPGEIGTSDGNANEYCGTNWQTELPPFDDNSTEVVTELYAALDNPCAKCDDENNEVFNPNSRRAKEKSIVLPTGFALASNTATILRMNDSGALETFDDGISTSGCGFASISRATRMPAFIPLVACTTNTGPDLVAFGTVASKQQDLGGGNIELAVFTNVRNIGQASSGATQLQFYLSDDTAFDSGDSDVGNPITLSALPSGGQEGFGPVSLTVPESAFASSKFLLARAIPVNGENNVLNNTDFTRLNDCPISLVEFDVEPIGGNNFSYDLTVEGLTIANNVSISFENVTGGFTPSATTLTIDDGVNTPVTQSISVNPTFEDWVIDEVNPGFQYTLHLEYYNDQGTENSITANLCSAAVNPNLMELPPSYRMEQSGEIANDNMVSDLELFPNPAADVIHMKIDQLSTHPGSVKIYNSLGKVVLRKEIESLDSKIYKIGTRNLLPGVYILSLETEGNRIAKELVILK